MYSEEQEMENIVYKPRRLTFEECHYHGKKLIADPFDDFYEVPLMEQWMRDRSGFRRAKGKSLCIEKRRCMQNEKPPYVGYSNRCRRIPDWNDQVRFATDIFTYLDSPENDLSFTYMVTQVLYLVLCPTWYDIVKDVIEDCVFFMPCSKYVGYFLHEVGLRNKHLIYLSPELQQESRKEQVRVVLHEIAHFALKHYSRNAEDEDCEHEADILQEKWTDHILSEPILREIILRD